jgi:cardiolipin synthase
LQRSVEPTDLLGRQVAVIESVSQSELTKGNKVTLLIDGRATYAAMFRAIRNARDHVNIETFAMEDVEDATGHRFADVLMQKQAEGVQVNLMYDAVGSRDTPASFFHRLRDAGIHVVEFNPIDPLKAHGKWGLTHRDHRKLMVVDGRIVITGGINIRQVYVNAPSPRKKETTSSIPWRDTDVQIEGPAVAGFQRLFLDTWRKQKGPDLSGRNYFPDLKEEDNALLLVVDNTPGQFNRITFITYVSAIAFANHSVHVTNAYFVPDRQILDALTAAARRGVDVKIVLPSITDYPLVLSAQRYTYSRLLKSGVQIYERRNALLHAKTAVIDGVWSTVGSSNMDMWSLLRDNELNAVILDPVFAADMEKRFAMDLAQSDPIPWGTWKRRSIVSRLQEYVAHLFARWL